MTLPDFGSKEAENELKAITAEAQYTDPLWVKGGQDFLVELAAGAGNTYVIQRYNALIAGGWQTVATRTTFEPLRDFEPVGAWWRVGCTVYAAAGGVAISRGALQ